MLDRYERILNVMKLFSRILSLLLCLLLLGGSALAVDTGADELLDRITAFWDSLDLKESLDLSSLTADIRALADESAQLDDEALESRIRALAEGRGLSLNDAQIQQLLQLIRTLETGIEKGNALKNKLQAFQAWVSNSFQALRDFFRRAADLFNRIVDWFDKLL